jgi:hypothetical protein
MNRRPRTGGELKTGFPGTGGDVRPDDIDERDVEGHRAGTPEPLHRRPPMTGGTGEGAAEDVGPDDAEGDIASGGLSRH